MKRWRRIAVFLAFPFVLRPALAQTSLEGTWTAHFLTPAGEIASTTYEVFRLGQFLQARTQFGGQPLALEGYTVENGRLRFEMNAGFLMECRLDRTNSGQFKGSCMDGEGNIGPAVIAPPGLTAEPEDLDINRAYAVWGLTAEEYEKQRAARYEQRRKAAMPESDPISTHEVDVGGHAFHVADVGSGDVTVVLESGIGDDHKVWSAVQTELADRARVVSYDRAGIGLSDASDADRSPESIARELRRLLDASGIEPPYVLVGHQAGSFSVQAFRTLYPEDVVGMVLVDPSHVDEDETWQELDARSWEEYRTKKRQFLSIVSDAAAREMDAYLAVLASDGTEARHVDVPAVVLSAQRRVATPKWVAETEEGIAARGALQRALAERLGALFIAVKESGSYIHLEQPGRVVDAIEMVLDAIEN